MQGWFKKPFWSGVILTSSWICCLCRSSHFYFYLIWGWWWHKFHWWAGYPVFKLAQPLGPFESGHIFPKRCSCLYLLNVVIFSVLWNPCLYPSEYCIHLCPQFLEYLFTIGSWISCSSQASQNSLKQPNPLNLPYLKTPWVYHTVKILSQEWLN